MQSPTRSLRRASLRYHEQVSEIVRCWCKAVERGEMEPSRAQALASLARAITVVFESGDAEKRLEALEQALSERDAA